MASTIGRPPFGVSGGPPPRAPAATPIPGPDHDWPVEAVDPRNFVGPTPKLSEPKASTPIKPSAAATPAAPAAPAPTGPQATLVDRQLMEKFLQRLQTQQLRAQTFGAGEGDPVDAHVRVDDFFLSRLPAQGLLPWQRKRTVRGTTAIVANTTYTEDIATLPRGTSLILMVWRQFWLDAQADPLDPDALAALQDDQDAYGRVSNNMLFNRSPVFDSSEQLVDPNGGAYTVRRISGFTTLNQNLLYVGNHPTAIYAPDASTITATWTTGPVVPGHIPSVVGVQLQGYTVPTKTFIEVLRAVRRKR